MENYNKAISVMKDLFGRDYQFCLASVSGGVPSQRYVDAYFDGECFYVVAYGLSRKVKEIAENPDVSLCTRKMYSFTCKAYNIGHPLKPENSAIRAKLTKAFEKWYFLHNNEDDENMCYIRIEPVTGFFHKNEMGYSVDFADKKAEIVPFVCDVQYTEE